MTGRAAAAPRRPVGSALSQLRLLWSSLVLLVRRARDVPPAAVSLAYDGPLRSLGVVLVGASVVELVVLELVVPWRPVRVVLLVAGAGTLLLVLAMTAANIVRPHVVSADRLRLRFGTLAEAEIPLRAVATVQARTRSAPGNKALLVDGDVLVMAVSGATAVDLRLTEPTEVPTSQGSLLVRTVRFAADDPAAAVRALREAADLPRPGSG